MLKTIFLPVTRLVLGTILCVGLFGAPEAVQAQQSLLWRDLFAVSFPSEMQGWVCGRRGLIAGSTDGGQTWNRQVSGTSYTLSSIVFTDNNTGWAVGDAGTIVHTTDGGKTWRAQKSPVDTYLMGICFADSRHGWISTEGATILATSDAGENWQIQFQDDEQQMYLRSISFCDALNGWVAGEFGYIYHTADGGRSWQKQAGFMDFDEDTGLPVSGDYIFSVHAVDPRTAWVVGFGKYVAKTTDGGETWQKIEVDIIPEVHLLGVSADSAGNVYIGGNGVFVTSTDGGETFHDAAFDPSIAYGWISGIAARGQKAMVAVGIKASIYRLNDPPLGQWHLVQYTK